MSRTKVVYNPKRALALGRKVFLVLACLAVLVLIAPLAGAQVTSTGTNVTVNFANGLQATFAQVTWINGPTDASGPLSPFHMPSIAKMGNAILSQGSFSPSPNFWEWYDAIQMNTTPRSTISFSFTNQSGNNVTWVLNNAYPARIAGVPAGSQDGAIPVQALEICFENVAVQQ